MIGIKNYGTTVGRTTVFLDIGPNYLRLVIDLFSLNRAARDFFNCIMYKSHKLINGKCFGQVFNDWDPGMEQPSTNLQKSYLIKNPNGKIDIVRLKNHDEHDDPFAIIGTVEKGHFNHSSMYNFNNMKDMLILGGGIVIAYIVEPVTPRKRKSSLSIDREFLASRQVHTIASDSDSVLVAIPLDESDDETVELPNNIRSIMQEIARDFPHDLVFTDRSIQRQSNNSVPPNSRNLSSTSTNYPGDLFDRRPSANEENNQPMTLANLLRLPF